MFTFLYDRAGKFGPIELNPSEGREFLYRFVGIDNKSVYLSL